MCRKASLSPLLRATKPNRLVTSNQATVPMTVMHDLRERQRQHNRLGFASHPLAHGAPLAQRSSSALASDRRPFTGQAEPFSAKLIFKTHIDVRQGFICM